MKWLKRIFLLVCLLVIAALVFAAVDYHRASATPDWYKHLALNSEQTEAAARRVEDGVIRALNMANRTHANERAARRGNVAAATMPLPGETMSFTQDDLNAFLHKHVYEHGQGNGDLIGFELPAAVADPVIALEPGEILIAGTLKALDKVVSLHLQPQLDARGRLNLNVTGIDMGTLPIPQAIFSRQRDQVVAALQRWLPGFQQTAMLDASGAANTAAVKAAMARLVLEALNHESCSPIFFIPAQDRSQIPVKLTHISVGEGRISVTFEVLDAKDRKPLLDEIRAPYPLPVASAQ